MNLESYLTRMSELGWRVATFHSWDSDVFCYLEDLAGNSVNGRGATALEAIEVAAIEAMKLAERNGGGK